MGLNVKKSGVYSPAAGMFVKKSGVYSAVQGLYVKVAGAYQNVLGSSLPDGYNIILAAGQSNMQGATALLVGTDDQTQANFYAWGTGKGNAHFHQAYAGVDPLDIPATGGINSGNTTFATHFARQYAAATGKKTLLVFVPVAATGLAAGPWAYTASPANPPVYGGNAIGLGTSNLYSNLVYEANQALAYAVGAGAEPASAVVGVLWAQGENDATSGITGAAHMANLQALIDGVRAQVTGAANSWFLINGFVPEAIYDEPLNHAGAYSNFRRISRALKKVANSRANTAYIRGSWGFADRTADIVSAQPQNGAIHYRNRGAWTGEMAPRAITALGTTRNRTAGQSLSAPATPSIYSLVATSDNSLRLQLQRDFSNGNTDLVIQTSTDGTNWSTYYAGTQGCYDYAEMVTIGALTANTGYYVRVADKNSAGTSAYATSSQVSTTNTGATAQYDFELDTVGGTPAGVTSMNGPLRVNAAQSLPITNVAVGKTVSPLPTLTAQGVSGNVTFSNVGGLLTMKTASGTIKAGTPFALTPTPSDQSVPVGLSPYVSGAGAHWFALTDIDSATGGTIAATRGGTAIPYAGSGTATTIAVGQTTIQGYDMWLDKIPVSADRTVIFRLSKSNTSNSGTVSLIMRAQPDSPAGSAYLSEMCGYQFLINYTATTLRIYKLDEAGGTLLSQIATAPGSFFGQKTDEWYRCSCIGTTLTMDYGTNGTTWTNGFTITDATYAAGGVQLNVLNSGAPADLFIDSITWS